MAHIIHMEDMQVEVNMEPLAITAMEMDKGRQQDEPDLEDDGNATIYEDPETANFQSFLKRYHSRDNESMNYSQEYLPVYKNLTVPKIYYNEDDEDLGCLRSFVYFLLFLVAVYTVIIIIELSK